jgi:hypothetical protein
MNTTQTQLSLAITALAIPKVKKTNEEKSIIMKTAHAIKKSAAKKWGCKINEIQFSICLKMANEKENFVVKVKTYKVENSRKEIMAKLSEHRRAQLREAQRKYRENRSKNGEKFVSVWVKENDPNQDNLFPTEQNKTIETIKALISKEREKNLYTERNKSLLAFIQKIEETLCLEK